MVMRINKDFMFPHAVYLVSGKVDFSDRFPGYLVEIFDRIKAKVMCADMNIIDVEE